MSNTDKEALSAEQVLLSKFRHEPDHTYLIIECMEEYAALRCKEKDEEIVKLKETMVAAAEEIKEFWAAHCDSEGYGPANLMRRLETGLGVNYSGYSAGSFTDLKAKAENSAEALIKIRDGIFMRSDIPTGIRHDIQEIITPALHDYNQENK